MVHVMSALNLNGIQLPTERKRKELRGLDSMGNSRATETIDVDISSMTEDDINWLLQSITEIETEAQVMLGNDPSGLFVDKRAGKPLRDVTSNVVMTFGSLVQRAAIVAAEKQLVAAIKFLTRARTGRASTMANWTWYYADITGGKLTPGRPVNPQSLGHLQLNERLYLVPNSEVGRYLGFANMRVSKRGMDFTPTRGVNKGVTRTVRKGFMGYAADKMRRNRAIKSVFRVWVVHTNLFGENTDYSYGVPCFVFRPTATLLNRRKYKPQKPNKHR